MKVNTRKAKGIVIFDFRGKIIGNDGIQIQKQIEEQSLTLGTPKFLFNFANVSMMDSIGLEALLEAHRQATCQGGRIGVINLGKNIRQLLVLTKLITVFERFDSEAKAIASLSSSVEYVSEERHSPVSSVSGRNWSGDSVAVR